MSQHDTTRSLTLVHFFSDKPLVSEPIHCVMAGALSYQPMYPYHHEK